MTRRPARAPPPLVRCLVHSRESTVMPWTTARTTASASSDRPTAAPPTLPAPARHSGTHPAWCMMHNDHTSAHSTARMLSLAILLAA